MLISENAISGSVYCEETRIFALLRKKNRKNVQYSFVLTLIIDDDHQVYLYYLTQLIVEKVKNPISLSWISAALTPNKNADDYKVLSFRQ